MRWKTGVTTSEKTTVMLTTKKIDNDNKTTNLQGMVYDTKNEEMTNDTEWTETTQNVWPKWKKDNSTKPASSNDIPKEKTINILTQWKQKRHA